MLWRWKSYASAMPKKFFASRKPFQKILIRTPALPWRSWRTWSADCFELLSSQYQDHWDLLELVTLMQFEHGLFRSHFFFRCWQSTHDSTLLPAFFGSESIEVFVTVGLKSVDSSRCEAGLDIFVWNLRQLSFLQYFNFHLMRRRCRL